MSDYFGLDLTDSPESSNIILPFTGQSEGEITSQQLISTGGLENPNSQLVPVQTPLEEQFLLGQLPLYGNNSSADILNAGETREASSISDAWNGIQNTFQNVFDSVIPEPVQVRAPGVHFDNWDTVTGRKPFWPELNSFDGYTQDSFEFNVNANADIQFGVKNPPFPMNVALVQNNSEVLASGNFDGYDDVTVSYPWLSPGNSYKLQVDYPPDVAGRPEIVINIDQAGESFFEARQLGNITGQRIVIPDFVGTNKGDSADYYQFEISEPRSLSYKVDKYDPLIDVEIMDAWGNRRYADETIDGAYSADQGGFIHNLPQGVYYAKVNAPQDPNLYTNYEVVFNLEQPPLFNSESPALGYFNELATWSDQQWDWAAGDNTRITGALWPGEGDETNYQGNQAILQIYNDMATTILGNAYRSSAGYVQDPSYFQAEGWQYGWHSGIDIDTPNWIPTEVRALVGGTAQVVQWNDGNQFLEIAGDDGRFYRYGHLSALKVSSGRVNQGDVIGEVGMSNASNHLHFQVNETQNRPVGYNSQDQNQVYQWTLNPLKVFWELKREGSI